VPPLLKGRRVLILVRGKSEGAGELSKEAKAQISGKR